MSAARLYVEVLVTLVVIMDPPGMLPVFLALTGPMPKPDRVRAARLAVLVALGVISAFAFFGQAILDYLHVTLPALQAAGGLLLLLIALELLTGRNAAPESTVGVDVALVPLGTPLLAGPGAIVATMVFVSQAHGWAQDVAIAAGIVTVHLILWATLRFSLTLHRFLRDSGVTLLSKIAGVLLSAIAVQLVADAVFAFVRQGR
jgi:multiple antibiotic resistance protein